MTGKVVYSAIILDHFRHPRYAGEIDAADMVGEANNPLCGDRIRIGIRIEGGAIGEARFHAEACAICTAAASLLMERIQGLPLAAANEVTEAELLVALGANIPAERERCATLPLEALRGAGSQAPRNDPNTQ